MKTLGLTVTHLTHFEAIEGLHCALDQNFQRLIENARVEWQRRFGGTDPSDACVSVRITAADAAEVRKPAAGCGFVKSTKKAEQSSHISLPHYAH